MNRSGDRDKPQSLCYIHFIMFARDLSIPRDLHRYEKWVILALAALLVFLALDGKGRNQREAYNQFLERAPRVAAALERFAADHDGCFPPDAMFCDRPQGLDDRYIAWNPDWRIDYEVHPNGQGGEYVCLEFGGPLRERLYFGLCNNPQFRRDYGQGQAIPGHLNRIWVLREEAPILERQPSAGEK